MESFWNIRIEFRSSDCAVVVREARNLLDSNVAAFAVNDDGAGNTNRLNLSELKNESFV